MATVIDHIDRLREKPEHIRHRIALGVSGGVTALVVVVWAMVLVSSGTLSLKATEVAAMDQGTGDVSDERMKQAFSETKSSFSSLMGAAGAAMGATSTEAALSIVSERTSTTMDAKVDNATDKTVISF